MSTTYVTRRQTLRVFDENAVRQAARDYLRKQGETEADAVEMTESIADAIGWALKDDDVIPVSHGFEIEGDEFEEMEIEA